jgi:predicted polyphosphate/ATP-dependent NAD kinase
VSFLRFLGPGKFRLGLIINPIAGVGGRYALKGSDGEAFLEALARGAELVSPKRASRFLRSLPNWSVSEILVPPGIMGEDVIKEFSSISWRTVDCVSPSKWPTEAIDTINCSIQMLYENIDLLVFVGGDGTARDVMKAIDKHVPVLGVPSGVKVYSSVFATSPESAAGVIASCSLSGCSLVEREVVDIDEEEFRRGRLSAKLYGYLLVPSSRGLVASSKEASVGAEEEKEAIAETVVELMKECTLYILGPGSTVKTIADVLGVEKTLLGVDAVHNGKVVGKDLDEEGLLRLLKTYEKAVIIVSPIGGQGFLFGRGNQQISPKVIEEVLRKSGREGILIVATKEKISKFKELLVDTGDPKVDEMLEGYYKVVVGYNKFKVMKVRAAYKS